LADAMRGVVGVFALTTPFEAGVDAEVAQGRGIVSAAGRTRVPHLVFRSVAGATQHTGVPHFNSKAIVETELAASGVPHTVLGPAYFFDNALHGAARLRDGVLDLPLPADRPLHQLAAPTWAPLPRRRCSLLETIWGNASNSPAMLPPRQMATALGTALDRPVRHEQVPLESIANPDMRTMWQFLAGPGYRIDIPALHAAHPDLRWTTFTDWASHTFATIR
jgi:hypothetical protein